MKFTKLFLFLVMAGSMFTSCEYEWIQPEKKPISETLSFSADIIPIFNGGCNAQGCHSPGDTPPDLSAGNAYGALFDGAFIDTVTPEASLLYTTMKSGSMKFYTNPGDEAIVLEWIRQGAMNN